MNSELNFSINSFIERRWSEAKDVLSQLDSAYLRSMDLYDSVLQKGLELDTLPQPIMRLDTKWHELLESTVDVSQHLYRLEFTVEKIEQARNRREAIYYFDTWVQDIYGLCEKMKNMISASCKVYSLGLRRDKYRQEVEERVQHNIGRKRHALVHGADEPDKGGLGINAKANTNEQLWEQNVAVGPSIIAYALDSLEHESPSWLQMTKAVTSNILNDLSAILYKLDCDITQLSSKA